MTNVKEKSTVKEIMKPWKFYAGLTIAVLLFGGGLALGYRLFRPAEMKTEVTAQVILTALRDRGFLVTQTYVFDQPVTIRKSSGSELKDFFFGQTITARGAMEVNLGIDLAQVGAEDVVVGGDKVVVTIPKASLFNVRPLGPLEVNNERGLLKRLLESDTGYNEALAELTRVAEETALKSEFVDRATEQAVTEVTRLLNYRLEDKQVEVRTTSQ